MNIRLLFYIGFLFIFQTLLSQNTREIELPKVKPPLTRILFVFDASNSMAGMWESDVKINIARKVLISMIDSIEHYENVQMALRVYGHQSPVPPQDCSDTRLEVEFAKNNASIIRQKLRYITPKGTTPIANSLARAANDFAPCENCRNVIILISDGLEACDGDPCAVSDSLQRMGIALKPFIIGIGIDENFSKTFECIGRYYNATNEEKFKEFMGIVISQALNSTTSQVNLLDEKGLPTETNVNMTFYDRYSGKVLQNYYHTLNHRGNPDTLVLDPLVTYRIVVNTLPPVEIDSVKVDPGKHTIAAVSAPQGMLVLKSVGADVYRDLSFYVRKANNIETVNYQKMGQTERYLVGTYDVEIPVLPRLFVKEVEIKQSSTTTLKLPRPGIVTFLTNVTGYGSLYIMRENKQEWIYNLNLLNNRSEMVLLQPGQYVVVFRSQGAKQSIYTVTKKFEINSGSSLALELY